ncbi:MAG: hypothetical protein A3A94_00255 [Candidatus Portnoybacteria bacterium RIFCSPLOWO2_01_FULL_43_11]|uniref:4Fe-4S ferredoxin-type domain-containing protein n=4 Tax=Candidatus Portnoyibacteriota TaxID=1817913 RepID=A0A1G2FDW8_9BACT|nr:MAG: hypothetical protein A2815_00015 [Candidatus Portnoybacteria bacterium RIFCSPHIGHO2_01_FULL_40_12b]OGZ37438.1 MAG: hypothetical protein A3D38_02275 [Candidatus Portnoybacteria bacterium RIFCSPHIGHO2_02_FULL_40_23]OGZ37977.1 MAG: hypothetical protein A3E90_02495 [Candidatus Portnoybacteria bacterium RIFCSPHIGHO2_12_FULL_40_11]OGZ38151.1 MAG: hypothetical protein A3A94_00255 [Candidatus Portnoybacteria bacterium RIFCSPLOWO2_01_FULL_43_11]OGZ40319.1 MAG: hypothetical protein A3I20_00130 [C
MSLIIEKKQIKNWLKELKKEFQVIDTRNSILPAKQYFLPPKEDIFIFNKKTKRLTNSSYQRKTLIFGLDLNDLEAMTQLDEIMKNPQPDFFYWQKREKSVLVGLTEESFGPAPGGDIIFKKINPYQYQAMILTEKGEEIINSPFFKKNKTRANEDFKDKLGSFRKILLDSEVLADAVAWSIGHKIWDELAKKCLSCGICTYVCPLCYCFSVEDKVNLDNAKCVRCRQWDACTLPHFARIAGGHNFHKTIKERYYNWFYHKFVRAYREYGRSQCVACGRCQRYCPAGIDIEKVLSEILEDYKKVKK